MIGNNNAHFPFTSPGVTKETGKAQVGITGNRRDDRGNNREKKEEIVSGL